MHIQGINEKHNDTIHHYDTTDDLLKTLGYGVHNKPRLSILGKALLDASNKLPPKENWLKKHWDVFFRKLRQEKRLKHHEKQNARHHLQPDVTHDTKRSS